MALSETQEQESRPSWLKPSVERHALGQYLATLRKQAWVVVIAVLATTGAAAAYVATAEETYEAEADVLVTPVPSGDTLLRGLGLIFASADPEREIETVARLLTARNVEERVERTTPIDPAEVEVSAEPVAESNLVSITAEAPSAQLARDAANAYADAAIRIRTQQFQAQLEEAILTLRNEVTRAAAAGALGRVASLARLRALRAKPDPTLRVEVRADAPSSPTWPRPTLSILVGALAGLVLGIGALFLWQLVDPRLRREEDLKEMFGLPILARIPVQRARWRRRGALGPEELSPQAIEAFRALRFTLVAAREGSQDRGSIFVTGPSPSEGKTTTCVNLAVSLATMGHSVILIEADLRRPAIGPAMRLQPGADGVASVLLQQTPMDDALVTADGFSENLRVLLADEQGEWLADQLSLPAARQLVRDAQQLADFVVIDSPPVTDVTDTLPLAKEAEDLLLVIRFGKSRLDDLRELGELLAQQGITPLGIVLVGAPRSRGSYYYYGGQAKKRWSASAGEPAAQGPAEEVPEPDEAPEDLGEEEGFEEEGFEDEGPELEEAGAGEPESQGSAADAPATDGSESEPAEAGGAGSAAGARRARWRHR
jgi:capsular exopolysaccharide synthesis family protein